MGDNNILPKGGFLRGVLAGLTLIALIFIGLAASFPLIVPGGPAPAIVSDLNIAPAQPVLAPEESSGGISINTDTPTPTQLLASPAPLGGTAPDITIAPEPAAPVSTVSQIETMPTNDIQIGYGESVPPVVAAPTVSAIEAPNVADVPNVEDTTEAPEVSVEITAAGETVTTTEPQAVEPVVELTQASNDPIETPTVTEVAEEPTTNAGVSDQAPAPSSEPTQITSADTGNAFETFSAVFADDGDLPLMSFILAADTVAEADLLKGFSTPITLAVASDNPAANEMVASFRATGGEAVLLLPSEGANVLSKGGNPADAGALLDATLAKIDGVLGVMDGPDGNVNQDTRMMSAMLAKLSETGHAIMTVNGLGLNRTSILASEAGVPAADISRVVNTEDGTIAVIRELDKVVLQIGDQRAVTIFAKATPELLFALKFWLESQKAQAVTIAPVSASILRN
ncbi:MAG: divergent polysaccharide deacetylase family protein [Rhodobacteraceae bacterium]|nr:divergent polysaccharide deacetylase family protein [Paracoccaceae bacterium]